ncbi:phage repressor,bifunctional HTH-domain containing protein/aminotransferase,Helix-turn-helix domain [[Clostridium] sordellii]|uniref:hypothetical protein n=1 Tax=Paraclostridium sordellii TaxID=1505 RepID=UPI000542059A|nr:hypothetical protein [Paeniclostridium sordellii]CEK35730.1 phage repressor,bifunctional HTH-domain containing protein/aminotransferase,Helix-turn-helix domain [[Clostridium] sordellii] [Paeniclostridium sordellii]
MNIENTSNRLKKILKDRNLRQVDLLNLVKPYCEKYNVKMNKSDISQYISGLVKPGQDKLFVLGKALDINESWLMGYDVPMERIETTLTSSSSRLKAVRNSLKLEKSELASKLNVDTKDFDDYEMGNINIPEKIIDDLCFNFNVNKNWLIHGQGKMFNNFHEDPEFNNCPNHIKDTLNKFLYLPAKEQELIKIMVDKMYEDELKKEETN